MKLWMRFVVLGLLIATSACAGFAITIQNAKALEDGIPVSLSGKVVTHASITEGFFYIEEDLRTIGIRVKADSFDLAEGIRAEVVGSMSTDPITKERFIQATSATPSGPIDPNDAIKPIGMGNKALGGGNWSVVGTGGQQGASDSYGVNNIGLLVTTWGRFHQINATSFTVDDGSGLNILCTVPSGTFLFSGWQYVVVTGISSMYKLGDLYPPVLLVRGIAVTTPAEALSTPGTPTGQASPLLLLSYGYTTAAAACTQGHPVEYSFNWGDGTSSSWSTSTTAFHAWSTVGAKTVTVTARCQSNPSLSHISGGLVVTPVAQLAANPWPMFRHDLSHSGISPYNDPVLGGTAWATYTGNGYSSTSIASDGTIYVAGVSSSFHALNADGTFKWSKTAALTSSPRSTPAIGPDGRVYIGSSGRFYAFTSAGVQKWYFTVSGDVSSSPILNTDGTTVYIGSRGGYLYALNPGTVNSTSATRRWQASVGDMHMTSPVLSANGDTIFTGGGSTLWAINTSNGVARWTYPLGVGMTSSAALSPNGSTVYIGAYDGNLYAVNATTGNLVWKVQVGFKNAVTSASPAIGPDGTIYLGSNYGSLYAINPDGSQKWIFESKADIRSSVAINADGTVILACYDGYVHAINSATGAEKWRHLLPVGTYASPSIAANGTVVVISTNGIVYGNIGGTPTAAKPPTVLTATMPTNTQAVLSWTDNSTDEYGFRVEKRVGTVGPFTMIPNADTTITTYTVGSNVATYTNSSLQSGQIYYYRVCAVQSGGDSAYSNEVTVVTPGIQTPAGLVATPVSASQVNMIWTDRSSDELGFIIERSSGPNGLFNEIARVGADVSSYTDTCVYPATNYYYRVKAYDATRVSSSSNEDWALIFGKDFSEIYSGSPVRQQMALTFDAGTANIRTGLLTTLKTNNVYSTFFITGVVTELQSAQVAQIARDGHLIGNHSYDHPDLRYCTPEQIDWQLDITDDIIYAASGMHTRSFFRAPYGAKNDYLLATAADDGFRHVNWTIDSGDAGGASTATIISRALTNAAPGAILLCHCTIAETEAAVPSIITGLRGAGYELVTVPELVAPTQVTSPVGELNAQWNLISLPIDPALEFPHIVFRGVTIDGNLKRWDRSTATEMTYSAAAPGPFGNIYADEGYWLWLSAAGTVKLNGAPATTARRIKLPVTTIPANYTLIGYPFQTAQNFANCMVYNPSAAEPKTRSVAEAITLGWIPNRFYTWNSVTQTEYDVSVPGYSAASTQLQPWRGYRGAALVPGVELIIPMP